MVKSHEGTSGRCAVVVPDVAVVRVTSYRGRASRDKIVLCRASEVSLCCEFRTSALATLLGCRRNDPYCT